MPASTSRPPRRSAFFVLAASVFAALALGLGQAHAATATAPAATPALDNATCLSCHDGHQKLSVPAKDGATRTLAAVSTERLGKSVHAKLQCVQCHTDIVDAKAKHEKAAGVAPPDCATCHTALWERAKAAGAPAGSRLDIVVRNIAAYQQSFHARPDADDPTHAKATCADCHASHDFAVPPAGTPARDAWRMTIPEIGRAHV